MWKGKPLAVVLAFLAALLCAVSVPVLATPAQEPVMSSDLSQQGKALYDAGRYAESVRVLKQTVQTYKAQSDDLRQAMSLSNLSLAYQQLGDWSNANQAIADSLALLNSQPSKLGQSSDRRSILAQTLDVQGRLQLATGQPEQALRTWQQATNAYTSMGDRAGETRSQINQAQALQSAGFYRRASEILTQQEKILNQQPDSLTKAVGLRSLGDALQLIGDPATARLKLQESLEVAERLKSPENISATLFSLGNVARSQQNSQEALTYYQQAADRSPSIALRTQAQLNRLSLLVETGDKTQAQTLLPQLSAQINALPASRAAVYAYINLAQSEMKLNQKTSAQAEKCPQSPDTQRPTPLTNAARLLAKAVQQAHTLGDQRAEAYALGNLGSVYEQTHQCANAQRLTEQALMLAQSSNAADVAYRWQWQLGRLLKNQGDIPQAITAYEAAVSSLQSLRADLVAINRDVQFNFRDSVEPVYRETVELLLRSQEEASSQADSPNDKKLENVKKLEKARQLMESLQLAELDNFFRQACLNAQSVVLDKVVDQDNPTTAIFYPIILEDQLSVILKVPGQPLSYHTKNVSRQEVEQILTSLQQQLKRPDSTKPTQASSKQVYDWLIQPVEAKLISSKVNTLVFVLDGQLRNIPMAALYDGQQYLVEKYAVALSPGLQLFTPQPLSQTKLTALTAGLSNPPPPFEPLPGITDELNRIDQAGVITTRLEDSGFTSDRLKQEINALPFKVVHLATHGKFSSQAKDTYILAYDKRINVNELDGLFRSRSQNRSEAVELLVLSACETAAGDNRAALGLAGVAIRAGARSTLASLWSVPDQSTSVLIGEFYRELANENVTKAEALRRAQVKLLKNPNYSKTLQWAPYVLIGNWL